MRRPEAPATPICSITLDFTDSTSDVLTSPPTAGPAARVLLMRVGASTYACEISDAQEIIPARPATRIPGAPAHVRGLINVRGSIVTVLDLGARLDPARPSVADGFILLVRQAGIGGAPRLVGVAVDEVLDVRVLDEAPVMPGGAMDDLIRGIGRVDDMDVILIDLDRLIQHTLLSLGGAS
jgi:purine-binding chemotaxis protein CheW